MKIRVECDENIFKCGEPDISSIEVERSATTIGDVLSMFEDVLLGLGYRFDGQLVIECEDDDNDETFN